MADPRTAESPSERYRRRAQDFAETLAAVPADRWASASPCEGWTTLDVVRHVVESPTIFFGLVGHEPEPGPPVEDTPVAAFAAVRAQVQAALDDPVLAGEEFDGMFGRMSFAAAIDRFVSFDLVVHRWDVARAAGLDTTLDPGDVAALHQAAEAFGDAARGPGAFGPALDPPEGAGAQVRLLAFLGRRS